MRWRFLLFYPFDFLIAMVFRALSPFYTAIRREGREPWVIGGHRGRIYSDNASVLHRWLLDNGHSAIWISANSELTKKLRSQGCAVVRKNSCAARFAILRAPVLVYSHGEDDLDQFLKYFRNRVGFRVFLNHGHHLLKGVLHVTTDPSGVDPKELERYFRERTDFDLLPTGSPYEQQCVADTFIYQKEKILPFGGHPRLDAVLKLREIPPERLLLWFPTWRDTPVSSRGLDEMIRRVVTSPELARVLEETDCRLALLSHINSKSTELVTASERITFHPPSELVDLLGRSGAFITDYSSAVFDWMLLDRPTLFFTFDQELYTVERGFFMTPEELAFGPIVKTPEELIELIGSERWREREPYREKYEEWMQTFFPHPEYGFTERTYRLIIEEAVKFWESAG